MNGKWRGKKVAVLLGGTSKEREISLRTGNAIIEALKRREYNVVGIDVTNGFELVARLKNEKPDVVLIALHGKYGEDGCVQGLLEMLHIPYTGGGVMASSVGMDKVITNHVARELGIVCPEEMVFDFSNGASCSAADKLSFGPPVIVKPSREGSTINMTIVHEKAALADAIKKAIESDTKVIVQKYIKGKEITIGILNGRALPALEVAPKSGFYDYTSKYTKGMTEYIVPARIDKNVAERIQGASEMLCKALECEGTARADYIVTEDNRVYFLEINTIPGMTELSLVPKAAKHIGIGFDDICEQLLDGARLKVN